MSTATFPLADAIGASVLGETHVAARLFPVSDAAASTQGRIALDTGLPFSVRSKLVH